MFCFLNLKLDEMLDAAVFAWRLFASLSILTEPCLVQYKVTL